MDFTVPTEARQIYRAMEDFIDREVVPLEEDHPEFLGEDYETHILDEDNRQVPEYRRIVETIQKKSADAGFWGMTLPEDLGGGGVDILTNALISEWLADRPPSFGNRITITGGPSRLLAEHGTDEQLEEYYYPVLDAELQRCFALTEPAHGSDPHYMDTTAEKDGDEWVIDGHKVFISNGPYADFATVYARTSGSDGDIDGITCFIVDADTPGMHKGKIHRTMGHVPGRQCELRFDECRVGDGQVLGEVGGGFTMAMDSISGSRLFWAANGVGRAQYLLDIAVEYARDRETFGRPIGHRQGVSFQLADLAADIEQARWLYRYAAWKMTRDERARTEESMAKLRSAEVANRAADVALQVHGGAGYMKSLPIEREYRGTRALRLFEGTDEILRRTIARELI